MDTDDWIDSSSEGIDERMLMLSMVTWEGVESDKVVFDVSDAWTELSSDESMFPW